MTIGNSIIDSFLLAVLVYFLFKIVIDALIKDPKAHEIFHVILIIVCVLIALGGTLFIHA